MSNGSGDYLTLKETAQHFGVSVQTIRRWIKDGKLDAELHDSPYGQQYFIPSYQIQTAAEIKDVVKVDRTVDMTSLARVMEHYLTEREQALLAVLESVQSEIRESIQQQKQREESLVNEIAAAREENRDLRKFIENQLEERDRKLMETLRTMQENTQREIATAQEQQKKRRWWPFG